MGKLWLYEVFYPNGIGYVFWHLWNSDERRATVCQMRRAQLYSAQVCASQTCVAGESESTHGLMG